jgi:hypothetical protein
MLGLRPRPQLRARSSLIDLIAQSKLHRSRPSTPTSVPTSSSPYLNKLVEEAAAVPLPDISISNEQLKLLEATEDPVYPKTVQKVKMAPTKKERKAAEAEEDQYGAVFSVSGPVIVAENMLGCAMYELVRIQLSTYRGIADLCRFVLVTIS